MGTLAVSGVGSGAMAGSRCMDESQGWSARMSSAACAIDVPSETESTGCDMTSASAVFLGSRPRWTIRLMRSRSVNIPTHFRPTVTATDPTLRSVI